MTQVCSNCVDWCNDSMWGEKFSRRRRMIRKLEKDETRYENAEVISTQSKSERCSVCWNDAASTFESSVIKYARDTAHLACIVCKDLFYLFSDNILGIAYGWTWGGPFSVHTSARSVPCMQLHLCFCFYPVLGRSFHSKRLTATAEVRQLQFERNPSRRAKW